MRQTLRGEASLKPSIRLLAYYLPQFYPIPENDRWWGRGFTEWTNVTRAKPLFRGHYQPRLPRDLGFYDLRVPETRERQAELARDAGIEGFCYWHYWFGNGRRILDRPFEEVLNSGKPDFPFCLSWANQTWSGIWYGEPKRTLIEQIYPGPEDEKAHFDWALPAFRDHRYVRIDGKPVFLVYDPHSHPDPTSFIAHWQRLALENGLPGIHFIAMSNDVDRPWLVPFDSITQFGPTDFLQDWPTDLLKRAKRRLRRRDFGPLLNRLAPRHFGLPQRYPYKEVVAHALSTLPDDPRFIPCVLPGWDNTPRSGQRGVIFEDSTPELFRTYLHKAIQRVSKRPPDQRLVFVKAWNEWAEGNYLEPDQRHGRAFLDVIKTELFDRRSTRPESVPTAAEDRIDSAMQRDDEQMESYTTRA